MNPVSFLIRPVQVLIVGGVLVLASGASLKVFAEIRGASERDRLVSSIVREQFRVTRERAAREPAGDAWSDDSPLLRDWVIQKAFVSLRDGGDPHQVSASLQRISQGKKFSPLLATSLHRWQDTLSRWSHWNLGAARLTPEELLDEARKRHFEAAGYRKIGRSFDATVLYLWSTAALERMVERWPGHPLAAEAMYLLGEAMFRLRQGPRLLNLCAEAYADSIWSRQAKAMWNQERGNGT